MDVLVRNAGIKRLLVERYGKGNVRVKGGTGSAYGWVHVRFAFPQPAGVTYGAMKQSIVTLCREADFYLDMYHEETMGSNDKLTVRWAD